MQIKSLYRITSHKHVVEVDDASTSPNKLSKQVLIFESELPEPIIVKKFTEGTSVGIIIVVDTYSKQPFNTFDIVIGDESNLTVVKQINFEVFSSILCLSNDYITFFLGQKLNHIPKIFSIKVITLSDRAHRGIYADKSGPLATILIADYFKQIKKTADIKNIIIPDSADEFSLLLEESKHENTDIIITTGGTGIGQRDITIEIVKSFINKEIPGIMEMIRMKYGVEKPNALLSRGVAGTMNHTLIYTLPGNVKAVEEYLTEIFKTLDHLLYMIHSIDNH